MNTIITFFAQNSEGLTVLFFIWAFTLGVAIMLASRKGYNEGYDAGYDEGSREGVKQGRESEREARPAR